MQSAWNSWPQGRLITRLTPSTYSSKQTTHSTCLPIYFFHSDGTLLFFSGSGRDDGDPGTCSGCEFILTRSPGSGTPVDVLDLGRDLVVKFWSNGVVADELVGLGILGVCVPGVTIVWYVRTGNLSTTDLGALHRRLRILDLMSNRA